MFLVENKVTTQFKTSQNFKMLDSQLLFSFPSIPALCPSSSLMRGMGCDQVVFSWEWREHLTHFGSEPHWISLKYHSIETISWVSLFHCSVSSCTPSYDFVFSQRNLCQAAVSPRRKGDKPQQTSAGRVSVPVTQRFCWQKGFKTQLR